MAAGHSSNSDWTLQVLKSDSNSHFTVEDAAKLANIKGPISSNEYERVQALRNSKALDLDDLDERFMCLVNLAGKVYKVFSFRLNQFLFFIPSFFGLDFDYYL